MKSALHRILYTLFALLSCAIAIEYKYDRVFRHFSKRLTPPDIPKWFAKQILFYPSDWIVLLIFGVTFWIYRDSLRRFLFDPKVALAACFPLSAALSIAASPLWHYPILYFHVWQYATAFFLFAALSCIQERETILKVVFSTLILMGTFEAFLGISQYFTQHSLGLRYLGEMTFNPSNTGPCAIIPAPFGYLWIFDRIFDLKGPTELAVRALGTFSHTNVLGGFLMMTSLITLSQIAEKKRHTLLSISFFVQIMAITLTFSRAAIFAFFIGLSIWLYAAVKQNREWKGAFFSVALSWTLAAFLFQDQIVSRGGLVNYNTLAQGSDISRLKFQSIATSMIFNNPLFGVGHEQFLLRFSEYVPRGSNPADYFGVTHNIYLVLASETGLISLASYLALVLLVLWIGWKEREKPYVPTLLGIFIGFLFIGGCDYYLLTFQSGRLMFFLIAGLIATYRPINKGVFVSEKSLSSL
jgi:hypothetical protein